MAARVSATWEFSPNYFAFVRICAGFPSSSSTFTTDPLLLWPDPVVTFCSGSPQLAHSPYGPGARAAQAPEFSVPRYVFALAPVISIPACTSITSKSRSETRASQAPSVDCWVSPWLRLKCAAEKMLKVSVLNVNCFQLCRWPRGTELPSQWDHCTFLSS